MFPLPRNWEKHARMNGFRTGESSKGIVILRQCGSASNVSESRSYFVEPERTIPMD